MKTEEKPTVGFKLGQNGEFQKIYISAKRETE